MGYASEILMQSNPEPSSSNEVFLTPRKVRIMGIVIALVMSAAIIGGVIQSQRNQPSSLVPTHESIEVVSVQHACGNCARFIEIKNFENVTDGSGEEDKFVYLEPASEGLMPVLNNFGPCAKKLRLSGQFYVDKGIPKLNAGEGAEPARIFRFEKIEAASLDKHLKTCK